MREVSKGLSAKAASMARNCLLSCAASSSLSRPNVRLMKKEIVAEMVLHVSTVAVPLTAPKIAPAETVRTKAAAIGTTWRKIMIEPKTA